MAAVDASALDDDASLALEIGGDDISPPAGHVRQDFNTELIVLVKAFPDLYDKSLITFRNVARRTGIWRNIATKLRCSVDTVHSRWRLLRDRYARELKKRSLPGGKSGPKWHKFNAMSFLQPHVRRRGKSPNIEWDNTDNEESDGNDQPTTSASKSQSKVNNNSGGSSSSDFVNESGLNLRARKRARPDVSANEMMGELRQTQETFNGLATHLLSGSSTRTPPRRIDTLCQLMERRYGSLPIDLQEAFDIEVLRLLQDFGKRAAQKESEVGPFGNNASQ